MKTALVTGATGFIGSHLCSRLYEDHYVIAVGTNSYEENTPKCHKFYSTQAGIPAGYWSELPDIDVCFHQAANNDTIDMFREGMILANYSNPICLFERLAEEKNCKQFVYASSGAVYGNQPVPFVENVTKLDPLNPYAESKKMFEEFATSFSQKYGVNTIGLRYHNVYGPCEKHKGRRASMIHQLLQKMLCYERPKLFKYGEYSRDWVYVADVVEANMLASTISDSGVYNVGSGEETCFNEIVKILNKEIDRNFEPEYVDCPFLNMYQFRSRADLTKISKIGYTPKYSIRTGIQKFIEEIKKAGL